MLKKMLAVGAILLSTHAVAESAPDCSPDKDARIYLGLITSMKRNNLNNYANDIAENSSNLKIKLLSSNKINSKEKKRLMIRRAQQFNFTEKDIKESGIGPMYMKSNIFRQYYEITTPSGFHAIAEFYSLPHYCGVDIENIHIISTTVNGSTPSFVDRLETPY